MTDNTPKQAKATPAKAKAPAKKSTKSASTAATKITTKPKAKLASATKKAPAKKAAPAVKKSTTGTAPKIAIYTSCATNYVPKARVLAESVKRFHPEIDMFLLAVDELPPALKTNHDLFDHVVAASDLNIPDFERWIFGHTIVEACTAVKPFMLQYLLARGYDHVIYFDPDIALFSTLEGMLKQFSTHSILLTPHLCKPEETEEAVRDNELSALKHGVFNFGYVGVKNDEIGNAYADWWAKRCYLACYADIANGVFTDQKWNDLVPVFFDKVKILKEPVYNVATWNYAGRKVTGNEAKGFKIDGKPLVFHHFTGYDSGAHHAMLDKYGKHMPATKELSNWYENACQTFEQKSLSAIPWAYAAYDNGEKIMPHHRVLYRQRIDLRESFPEPFSTKKQGRYETSYYYWLEQEDLLEHAPLLPDTAMSFREFLNKTQHQLEGYIARTNRMSSWQKKAAMKFSDGLFALLRIPLKKKKAA